MSCEFCDILQALEYGMFLSVNEKKDSAYFLIEFVKSLMYEQPETWIGPEPYYPYDENYNAEYLGHIVSGKESFSMKAAKQILKNWCFEGFKQELNERGNVDFIEFKLNELSFITSDDLASDLESILFESMNALAKGRELDLSKYMRPQKEVNYCRYADGVLYLGDRTISIRNITKQDYSEPDGKIYEKAMLEAFEIDSCKSANKIQAHYMREQRVSYYSAEYIRQSLKDCEEDGVPSFELMTQEVDSAFGSLYWRDYSTPKERMYNVTDKSMTLSLSKSCICRDTGLISQKEKQGICHILINEKYKTWNPK